MNARCALLLWIAPVTAGAAPTELRLAVHRSPGAGGEAERWLAAQLVQANALFATCGLRFVAEGKTEPSLADAIPDRARRNALAALAPRDGAIHVFVIGRLADLDHARTFIGGVHWRYRGGRRALEGRRYIIVSPKDARHDTLAHELGHYFGLAHRRERRNLMTAPGRLQECELAAWQRRVIASRLRLSLRARELRASSPTRVPAR